MHIPFGAREARQLGAQIQFGLQRLPNQFVQLKRVVVQHELRGKIETQGHVSLQIQFHLVPTKIADVSRAALCRQHVLQ